MTECCAFLMVELITVWSIWRDIALDPALKCIAVIAWPSAGVGTLLGGLHAGMTLREIGLAGLFIIGGVLLGTWGRPSIIYPGSVAPDGRVVPSLVARRVGVMWDEMLEPLPGFSSS